MIIDGNTENISDFVVIDSDTGEALPFVIYADDQTGKYISVVQNSEGEFLTTREGKLITKESTGRIEIRVMADYSTKVH